MVNSYEGLQVVLFGTEVPMKILGLALSLALCLCLRCFGVHLANIFHFHAHLLKQNFQTSHMVLQGISCDTRRDLVLQDPGLKQHKQNSDNTITCSVLQGIAATEEFIVIGLHLVPGPSQHGFGPHLMQDNFMLHVVAVL